MDDTSVTQTMNGSWTVQIQQGNVTVNGQNKTFPIVFTRQNGSSLSVPFNGELVLEQLAAFPLILTRNEGTQVEVISEVPTGNDPLVANYTIDDGTPTTRSEVGVDSSGGIQSATLFASPQMEYGSHKLDISVLQTGGDRNYVLYYFAIFNGTENSGTSSSASSSSTAPLPSNTSQTDDAGAANTHHSTNTTAIVAGVLGGLLFVAAILLGFLFYKRRRRTKGVYLVRYLSITPSFSYNDFPGEISDNGTGTASGTLNLATPSNISNSYPFAATMPSPMVSNPRVGRTAVSVLSLPPYSSVGYTVTLPDGHLNNPYGSSEESTSFPLVYAGQRKMMIAS